MFSDDLSKDFILCLFLGLTLRSSSGLPEQPIDLFALGWSWLLASRWEGRSFLFSQALSLPLPEDFPNLLPRSWEGPGAPHSQLTPLVPLPSPHPSRACSKASSSLSPPHLVSVLQRGAGMRLEETGFGV